MLRGQIADIVAGSIFVFVGLATCAIAAFRRGRGIRMFVWLGMWRGMYDATQLARAPAMIAASPRWLQIGAPYAGTAITFLLVVVGCAHGEFLGTRCSRRSFAGATDVRPPSAPMHCSPN